MAISWDDFDKIWASTSPLTPYSFSDNNYKQGWNFVGATPPARQMWDSIQKANDEKFKFLRDNFGTPNIVTTASQMTDTGKVYVYMGSEAGWSNGHWYYYNGTAWADGGVYNSVAFMTDSTLTLQGQPADAKAVGDALALKADLAGATFTGDIAINADLSTTGTVTVGTDLSVAGDSTLENITANGDVTVAGTSTLASLFVEGTTALAGTSTAVTPNADDNSTNIATTEYVQTEIKPIEADVSANDKRISNIEKLLKGNLYDYQTDSTEAYTKTVPAGAMPYAGLEKLGGKTIVWNQTFDISMLRGNTTSYGVTSEKTDNGVRLHGAFTLGVNIPIINGWYEAVVGHRYLITNTPVPGSLVLRLTQNGVYANWQENTPFTATDTHTYLAIRTRQTSDVGVEFDITWTPQIFDLTLMFGAGHEPSTYEEFQQMFPASYYPYNAGELLSAGVTEIAVKYHTSLLRTFSIPAAVQQLDGYGWSAGTVSNVVDFERKYFRKSVKSVDLGTLNWTKQENNIGGYYFRNTTLNPKAVTDSSSVANIICSKLTAVSFSDVVGGEKDNVIGVGIIVEETDDVPLVVYISDNQEMTPAQFKESLSGVYLYYEQYTPQSIDISSILTNDNLFDVSGQDERDEITLTFKNINGDNYRIPVPSTEEYMINLQEAVSNG